MVSGAQFLLHLNQLLHRGLIFKNLLDLFNIFRTFEEQLNRSSRSSFVDIMVSIWEWLDVLNCTTCYLDAEEFQQSDVTDGQGNVGNYDR